MPTRRGAADALVVEASAPTVAHYSVAERVAMGKQATPDRTLSRAAVGHPRAGVQ